MEIQAPAISGCTIKLLGDVVVKECPEEYAQRLADQCDKQRTYHQVFALHGIRVPMVLNYGRTWFSMEYLPYIGYIKFIETASYTEVKKVMQRLLEYLDASIADMGLYWQTCQEDPVEKAIAHPSFPIEYQWLKLSISRFRMSDLPLGRCHGDLTFSNLLFGNGNIAVIDFNDTPVSSPIFDVIKLRQDAKFHWTSFATPGKHDRRKIELVDSWFLAGIDSILMRYKVNIRDYKYWEALNYLKIFRNVAGDKRMCEYLVKNIMEILA